MTDTTSASPPRAKRLASIDMLRGFVMVLMALDHVRDMLTQPQAALLDFSQEGGALFFTRWITHICAPTFVLLAGTGAFLYGAHGRRKHDIARFLLSRGLWLVLIELTVVNFAWNFNVGPRMLILLQVIWAIGWSMVALAGLVWLPLPAIGAIGTAMVLGHNLLDGLQPFAAEASPVWLLLHIQGRLTVNGNAVALIAYPLIPWIGVMALGYVIGPVFVRPDAERSRRLVQIGVLMTLAFFALRLLTFYGEPVAWAAGAGLEATLVSFFNVTKYPPSLQFLLMTLGPATMLLGWFERLEGRVADALATIGRVPFFYYVVHLYVIHAVAIAVGLLQGFSIRQIAVVFFAYPPGFGIGLGTVYLLWMAIVLALYPACRWFADMKARRREWWLSYL
jgi:uncharacterized membrane protein